VPKLVQELVEVVRCPSHDEPRPAVHDADPDAEPDPGDGLTDAQRWEGWVAETEDQLPRSKGAIQGVVRDAATGEPLAGVTIIVTSPVLEQTQSAISDENGYYKVIDLPPGNYTTTFYYADVTIEHSGLAVSERRATPLFQTIDSRETARPIPTFSPTIDVDSTSLGITIDKNYIKNIPVPGRTFETALGAAAGEQVDSTGVSFSGSDALENEYYLD